jgi:hypothetical protein
MPASTTTQSSSRDVDDSFACVDAPSNATRNGSHPLRFNQLESIMSIDLGRSNRNAFAFQAAAVADLDRADMMAVIVSYTTH